MFCFLARTEPGMRRIDTHASIVFLGKDRVLKVKRAVRLPFLDYSTLEKRKHACDEELRVNTPFAPGLYRRVVAITQGETGLAIDGNGTPVEWAVEMARFDETLGLDRVAATTELQPALAVELADTIRRAHDQSAPAQGRSWLDSIAEIIDRNTARFRNRARAAGRCGRSTRRPQPRRAGCAGPPARGTGRCRLREALPWRSPSRQHRSHRRQAGLFDAIEFDPIIATTDISTIWLFRSWI